MTRPLVVGMGRVTLDIVFRSRELLGAQAGGTCGNVMAILAWLGWHAAPIELVGSDENGSTLLRDLKSFGVDVSRLAQTPDTTAATTHVIGEGSQFDPACFYCGCPLSGDVGVALWVARQALPLAASCRAFFFDQDCPAALWLAMRCREQGALVVWEPSYAGPEVDWEGCLSVAHVLKYSRSQLPGLVERAGDAGPRLVIETDAEKGLRWRLDGAWHDSPALPVPVVRDAAGAGDWTTAGFLAAFDGWKEEKIAAALRRGQAMGAWACAFDGARGGMYAATRQEFDREIGEMLEGRVFDPGETRTPRLPEAGRFCRCRA